MKKLMFLMMLFGLTLAASKSVSAQNCKPNDNQIAIYEDWNFTGPCKVLNVGTYANPQAMGFKNDDVSSIKVGKNVKTVLCANDNFGGNCEAFEADKTFLGETKVGNDNVSSIDVFPRASQLYFERVEVKSYELRWNDSGSGKGQDIALWHPKAPNGYFVFGSMGIGDNNENPNGKVLAYAYKPIDKTVDYGGKQVPVIVYPNDYERIWTDKDSNAKKSGSVWKPICPANYTNLGYVAMAEQHIKPSLKDVGCVLNSTSFLVQRKVPVKVQWKNENIVLATGQLNWGTDFLAEPAVFVDDKPWYQKPLVNKNKYFWVKSIDNGLDISNSAVRF